VTQHVAVRRGELSQAEAACVTPQRLTELRGEIVRLARETGCQIRRVNVGEAHQRPWWIEDDPLSTEPPVSAGRPPARYRLRSQVLSLSLSGRLASVREFLGKLLAMDALLRPQKVVLRPEGEAAETSLELECLLFDLEDGGPPAEG
jgi:hypothetical protein